MVDTAIDSQPPADAGTDGDICKRSTPSQLKLLTQRSGANISPISFNPCFGNFELVRIDILQMFRNFQNASTIS